MIGLYMDENVRGPITRGLRQRGVDVLTVQEDGRQETIDPEILDRAIELERVLYSEDEDLLGEAKNRQIAGEVFTGVIYAHHYRVPVGRCVEDLELIAKASALEDYRNHVIYLPL